MFENKKVITFTTPGAVTVPFQGQAVQVTPYISIDYQMVLAQQYLDAYFGKSLILQTEKDYIMAEYSLMFGVLDLCTDVDLAAKDSDGNKLFSMDVLLSNLDLWDAVRKAIRNYDDFYRKLCRVVNDVKEDKLSEISAGNILSKLTANITDAIEKLLGTEITDENLGKIKSLLADINASPFLAAGKDVPVQPKSKVKSTGKQKKS